MEIFYENGTKFNLHYQNINWICRDSSICRLISEEINIEITHKIGFCIDILVFHPKIGIF